MYVRSRSVRRGGEQQQVMVTPRTHIALHSHEDVFSAHSDLERQREPAGRVYFVITLLAARRRVGEN